MRFRRFRRWWLMVLVGAVALLVYAAWPGRSTFTISPETTYITEPLDENGQVDYQAALNERLGRGVTPETNANVLIWQALGPHPEGATMPPAYFQWLGVESPPDDGEYFFDSDKYFNAFLKDRPEPMPDEAGDQPKTKQPEPPPAPWANEFPDRGLPGDRKTEWDDQLERARKWPWKAAEQPDIADWLKRNARPLALTIEASKRPHYYHPLVSKTSARDEPKMMGSLLPSVQKSRALVLALKYRAMNRTADGDLDGAWQDLLACQRLGRLLMQSATLIEHLVGIAVVAIASDGQVVLLSQGKHSPRQVRAWLADLRGLPPFPPVADKMDLGERFFALDALMSITRVSGRQLGTVLDVRPPTDPPGDGFWDSLFTRSIDWDPAFRALNRTYERSAAAWRLPDRAARKAEFATIVDEVTQKKSAAVGLGLVDRATLDKAGRGERIGDIVIGLVIPALEKIQDASERIEQTHRNLQVAFALAAYRADTGRYPARLEELAPQFLPRVPDDLYSGQPLIYKPSAEGYVLYSVGMNEEDDDGRGRDDEPKGDDLRVRMPVKEPVKK